MRPVNIAIVCRIFIGNELLDWQFLIENNIIFIRVIVDIGKGSADYGTFGISRAYFTYFTA
jgi:hypothetical protein